MQLNCTNMLSSRGVFSYTYGQITIILLTSIIGNMKSYLHLKWKNQITIVMAISWL